MSGSEHDIEELLLGLKPAAPSADLETRIAEGMNAAAASGALLEGRDASPRRPKESRPARRASPTLASWSWLALVGGMAAAIAWLATWPAEILPTENISEVAGPTLQSGYSREIAFREGSGRLVLERKGGELRLMIFGADGALSYEGSADERALAKVPEAQLAEVRAAVAEFERGRFSQEEP